MEAGGSSAISSRLVPADGILRNAISARGNASLRRQTSRSLTKRGIEMRSISDTAISMCRRAWLPLVLCGVAGCGPDNPFDLVKVSGTLTYDDGTLIPANMIILKFEPLAAPLNTKTHPPSGMSYVNVSDGTFDVVTSHKYADGLVRGKHRVLVSATTASGDSTKLVPDEYLDSGRTPLLVDTAESPFRLVVRKP